MGKAEYLKNLWKYGTNTFLPQVDPKVMELIFKESLEELSLYLDNDNLALWKTGKDNLNFQYSTRDRQPKWFNGTIYVQKPRDDFDYWDIISYMEIRMINPDNENKIIDAISEIVKSANIEKIILNTPFGVDKNIAELLANIEGKRDTELYGFLIQ